MLILFQQKTDNYINFSLTFYAAVFAKIIFSQNIDFRPET